MEARQADAAGYISPPWAGTFIESSSGGPLRVRSRVFPFLFGGTFIEGQIRRACPHEPTQISLPFWKGFH